MQLSAANLLIASQQVARGAAKPPQEAQFGAALAKGIEASGFEPMDFKQTGASARPAPAGAPASAYSGGRTLGANIDIRV